MSTEFRPQSRRAVALGVKHKFDKGQRVCLRRHAPTDRYTITAQMPPDRQGFVYRIKGDTEPHERVVQEVVIEAVNW